MTKQLFRESIKSIFGSQIGPEKDEASVRNLSMRSGYWSPQHEINQRLSKRSLLLPPYCAEPALATGQTGKKVGGKIEDGAFSSSSSHSDSEYLSTNNGQLESEFQKITDGLRQELETTKVEVTGLKKALTASREEKGVLDSEHLSALSKIQESEKMIADLKIEAKRLADEKSKLVHDNEDLIEKLVAANKKEAELDQTPESVKNLKRDVESGENEASAKIIALTLQVDSLKQELQTQKIHLEIQLEREKQEFSESLTELESQNIKLRNHIADQQRAREEQEDKYNKIQQEYEQVEGRFQECKADLKVAERKIHAMAEDFRKNVRSKNKTVADLEEIIAELKMYLIVKEKELHSSIENVRTNEVKLRLSNQKLVVTEQLLTQKEEKIRIAETKFQQEQEILEEKILQLSRTIIANEVAHQDTIRDISERATSASNELRQAILQEFRKYQDDCRRLQDAISQVSEENQIVKTQASIETKTRMEQQKEIGSLVKQLCATKKHESELEEKVRKLEAKASQEEREKEKLIKAMAEKDEGLLCIREEKRQAIRQLCTSIEYHRSRYYQIKRDLSSIAATQISN